MIRKLVLSATLLLPALFPYQASADLFVFTFSGPGVSGAINLTFGTATDLKYPGAFEVTGISGKFTDTNNGLNIVNAPIGALRPITRDTPEATNLLAPNDFSKFPVAAGLGPQNNGSLSFDNLYYPGGSPQTASDYPVSGGSLDIYGLLFNIGGGRVVNFWSNGDFTFTGNGPIDYGVAVATPELALDYVGGGVAVAPEPSEFVVVGGVLLALLFWRRRAAHLPSL